MKSCLRTYIRLLIERGELDKVAFADERYDIDIVEPDNATEETLYTQLHRFFCSNDTLDSKTLALLRSFMETGEYNDVFKPPSTSEVYRGISVDEDWLKDCLEESENIVEESGEKEVFYISGKSNTMCSWTTNKDIATKFSNANHHRGGNYPYAVIMTASVSDNPTKFVSGPGGLYKLMGIAAYANEKEVIGLGSIDVHKINWKLR